MTKSVRWISMLATAAALGVITLPIDDTHGLLVPEAVEAAAAASCDKSAKDAPLNYTIKDMNGVDVKLASFKGKVILLNFWATWCGPCKAEIPGFVKLQEKYRDKGLVIVGYSVDDTAEKAKAYAAQYKMNYPILLGERSEERRVGKECRARGWTCECT